MTILCVLEAAQEDGEWARRWLDENEEGRIVFVDSSPGFFHPHIRTCSIDSPLQIEPLAKEIAWNAVFLTLEIQEGKSETAKRFSKELKRAHLAANLLLSDAADWGVGLARQAFQLRSRLFRQGMKLANAFSNIPAIIIGAGPSLEKNGHLLDGFRDRALVLAGGSALNATWVEPHLAAAIDKEAPFRDFKRRPFSETPFCFQYRTNPEHVSLIHGEGILFPDSHFQFLDDGEPFDGGWTVGTFLTALATLMGCDPIVFVGMDYCYQGNRKYAGKEEGGQTNVVKAVTRDGREVWTQPDWLMARDWQEEWAFKHPNHRFLNATEGGVGFAPPIQEIRLDALQLEKRGDLREAVHKAVTALPFASPIPWDRWKESLDRCKALAEQALFGGEEDFEGERAYEFLLLPLWQTWRPIFFRALLSDLHPDKLKINRLLFFQQVIEEHLRVIE